MTGRPTTGIRHKNFILANLLFLLLTASVLIPGKVETKPSWALLAVVAGVELICVLMHGIRKSAAASDICCILFAFLLLWEIVTKHLNMGNPVLVPPPDNVMYVFYTHGQQMLIGTVSSMELILTGFALSLAAGVSLGLFIGWIPRLSNMIYPIVKVLAPIPSVVYSPYIIAVMPSFRSASAMVIVLGLFFPTLMQMINRVHTMDPRIIASARTMNVGSFDMVFRIMLPYVMPGVVSGLRVSLTSSFMILVIAEMMGATSGLGYFIKNYADFANYTNVIAGIILVGVVVTLLNQVITLIQKYCIHWRMNG